MGQKIVPPIKPPLHMERLYNKRLTPLILDPTYKHYNARLIKTNSYAQALKVLDSKAYTPPSLATGEARLAVTHQVNQLNTLHKTELIKKFQGALGVDVSPLLNDPKTRLYLQRKVVENVALIKTIPTRFHASLANKLSGMAATGQIFDRQAVRKLLAEEYGSSGYNLRRLTRDQTSKMVGDLTKQRHTDMGIKKYQWFTAGDERVRDSHRNNEGGVFFWNKPPADTGHPGEDIQCRCSAIAILDTTTQKQIKERAAAARQRLKSRPLTRKKDLRRVTLGKQKGVVGAKYKSVNMNRPMSYSPFDPSISPEARSRAFEYRLTRFSKDNVKKDHSKIKGHVPESAAPRGVKEFEAWQHEFVNDFLTSPNRDSLLKTMSKENREILQRVIADMDEVTKPLADDFVTYRGMSYFDPKHSYFDDLAQGKVTTSRGYLQTTRDLEFPAEMYGGGNLPRAERGVNALFEIKAPKGTQAIVLGDEGHIIMGRGTKFRVVSVQRNIAMKVDGVNFRYDYLYQLEAIPAKKPPPIFKAATVSQKTTRRLKEISDDVAREQKKVDYYENYLKRPKSQQDEDFAYFAKEYRGKLKEAQGKIAALQKEASKLKGAADTAKKVKVKSKPNLVKAADDMTAKIDDLDDFIFKSGGEHFGTSHHDDILHVVWKDRMGRNASVQFEKLANGSWKWKTKYYNVTRDQAEKMVEILNAGKKIKVKPSPTPVTPKVKIKPKPKPEPRPVPEKVKIKPKQVDEPATAVEDLHPNIRKAQIKTDLRHRARTGPAAVEKEVDEALDAADKFSRVYDTKTYRNASLNDKMLHHGEARQKTLAKVFDDELKALKKLRQSQGQGQSWYDELAEQGHPLMKEKGWVQTNSGSHRYRRGTGMGGDCVTRAFTNAGLGRYDDVYQSYARLLPKGKTPDEGMYSFISHRVLRSNGFRKVPDKNLRGGASTNYSFNKTVKDIAKASDDDGYEYVIYAGDVATDGHTTHALYVRAGKYLDTWDSGEYFVKEIFRRKIR